MRRSKKRASAEQTEMMLRSGKVLYLALADGNIPYVVPMSYGYRDGVIYMHCANEGRKLDMLKKNAEAAFSIVPSCELIKKDTSCGWTFNFESVSGSGNVEFVTDAEGKRAALNVLMEHYGKFDNSYPDEMIDVTCVLKLTVKECSGKISPAPSVL
ncbi:pyridoxamine 5'-phosphate oxidase family protein [Seleniivibrio woodruffii]|uniref:pyridoxamine 5'-phosphate oxidase family protein n=1 Tax=Seleniivibrio woodruffii TaxID=1078050 RepID=UPI0039E4C97A